MKKIVLNELKKVLSEKELKHITGGYESCTVCCGNGGCQEVYCLGMYHCLDKAWEVCGATGWTTNCY